MVQMAFCDLSHTFNKQVTNVSQPVFVILLWGILTSPLMFKVTVDIEFGDGRGGITAVGAQFQHISFVV